MPAAAQLEPDEIRRRAREAVGRRNLVFVGLMGAGKSVIGRMTAGALQIPFVDSDAEIEKVSAMTISELFAAYGEGEFRALETRVIKRLLTTGPRVVSVGGGAFVNEESRALIKARALSVWLKADLETLWDRVARRDTRPLLKTQDPKGTLESLMRARYPIYGEADITVQSRNVRKELIVEETLARIAAWKDEDRPT